MSLKICDLEEMLKPDPNSMSPEEYMELVKSRTKKVAPTPEENIYQLPIGPIEPAAPGEITNMLRNTPGFLKPVERLPKQLSGNDSKHNGRSSRRNRSKTSQKTVESAEKYYNAREMYEMKRGNKKQML